MCGSPETRLWSTHEGQIGTGLSFTDAPCRGTAPGPSKGPGSSSVRTDGADLDRGDNTHAAANVTRPRSNSLTSSSRSHPASPISRTKEVRKGVQTHTQSDFRRLDATSMHAEGKGRGEERESGVRGSLRPPRCVSHRRGWRRLNVGVLEICLVQSDPLRTCEARRLGLPVLACPSLRRSIRESQRDSAARCSAGLGTGRAVSLPRPGRRRGAPRHPRPVRPDRPRLFEKRWAIAGVKRHQTGNGRDARRVPAGSSGASRRVIKASPAAGTRNRSGRLQAWREDGVQGDFRTPEATMYGHREH